MPASGTEGGKENGLRGQLDHRRCDGLLSADGSGTGRHAGFAGMSDTGKEALRPLFPFLDGFIYLGIFSGAADFSRENFYLLTARGVGDVFW